MHLLSNKLVTEMLRLNCFNKISGVFFSNECEASTSARFHSFCRFKWLNRSLVIPTLFIEESAYAASDKNNHCGQLSSEYTHAGLSLCLGVAAGLIERSQIAEGRIACGTEN